MPRTWPYSSACSTDKGAGLFSRDCMPFSSPNMVSEMRLQHGHGAKGLGAFVASQRSIQQRLTLASVNLHRADGAEGRDRMRLLSLPVESRSGTESR
jgi:hypothetical protein